MPGQALIGSAESWQLVLHSRGTLCCTQYVTLWVHAPEGLWAGDHQSYWRECQRQPGSKSTSAAAATHLVWST